MAMDHHARQEIDAGLAEFATLCLDAGRKLGAAIQAEDDPKALPPLVKALHTAGRSYRQTCALRIRLARLAVIEDRQDQDHRHRRRIADVHLRKQQITLAVQRIVWAEHERSDQDSEKLMDILADLLDEDAGLDPRFLIHDLQQQIRTLCQRIGLQIPQDLDTQDLDTQDQDPTHGDLPTAPASEPPDSPPLDNSA